MKGAGLKLGDRDVSGARLDLREELVAALRHIHDARDLRFELPAIVFSLWRNVGVENRSPKFPEHG
jgi:hypothetical protein